MPNPTYAGSTDHRWHKAQFFSDVAKQGISFVIGIVAAAYIYGGRTNEIEQTIKHLEQLDGFVRNMDKEGTTASKNALVSEARDIGRYEARLDKVEGASQKIDTLLYRMDDLSKSMEELKARPERK